MTASGFTALHLAVREGHLELVKKLLREGADVNAKDADGNTPLLDTMVLSGEKSLKSKIPDFVKVLLKQRADIDSKDQFGYTALMKFAGLGNEPVVRILLEGNAGM